MDDNKPKAKKRAAKLSTKTDLGIIQVISRGARDIVFLAHNRTKAFVISCEADKPSQLWLNPDVYQYEQRQWDEAFTTYLTWKRKQFPGFRLPRHSGRRTDGKPHPWRWHQAQPGPNKRKPDAPGLATD